ncbi:MAG: hypothetical protein ACTSYB_12800, partial [Candidatus Helarchaeota archaeon]
KLPPVVYTYSSGWKPEKPISYNLKELESQFFSFDKKVSWYYHLKGTVKIIEGNKSNFLLFIFDHSSDYKLYIPSIICVYVLFSTIVPFFTGIESIIFPVYFFLGPFLFFIFIGSMLNVIENGVSQYRETFMEELKEKILSRPTTKT